MTALCILAAMIAPGIADAARPLVRGFADDVWFQHDGSAWDSRAAGAGAQRVLVVVYWNGIEPAAPQAGQDPTDPAGPVYQFSSLDAIVRQLVSAGIAPAFTITQAPVWAEAPGGPSALVADGSWKPDAAAFGQMATALARRYSGSFPDPLAPGKTLPRVRYYQPWAEANFSVHLAPQWVAQHGHLVAYGATMYRSMLNAFTAGVKRVHGDDVVVTSGFGPYGDTPSTSINARTPPAQFLRELLCLTGGSLRPVSCPDPAQFDVLAIDPYEVGGPATKALAADDVSAPDLGKLTRIVTKALRTGRALPRRAKPLWVTEFSYDSRPPNPTALSLGTQARWLEESLYEFWTEHVDAVFWYLLRDQAATFNPYDYFSGLYFFGGKAKPALQAYRFPLVVIGSGRSATVWGISPRRGRVAVQQRRGRSWTTLFTSSVNAGGVFVRSVSPLLRGRFRAIVAGQTSLVWTR